MKFIHLATIAVICATAEAVRIAAGDDQIVETPDNFKKDSDDIFMRSMYEKYASHPKDMKTKKDIKEKVIITRGAALSLAIEVLETHKKLDGEVVDSVYTWMISYAPFNFPRYAVAFLIEDGVSGSTTIGPRLSALYQNIFEYDGTLAKEER